jgi:hypothetical protein
MKILLIQILCHILNYLLILILLILIFHKEVNILALNSELLFNNNFTNINISPNPKQPIDNNFLHFESTSNNYQYNLTVGDYFNNWSLVDAFIHNYYLK